MSIVMITIPDEGHPLHIVEWDSPAVFIYVPRDNPDITIEHTTEGDKLNFTLAIKPAITKLCNSLRHLICLAPERS